MPTGQTVALFMIAALALNLTPGPSILFILSRCMAQGRRAGIVSVFGLSTAALVHAVAVAFGLSALLVYSPLAFAAVKYCGAAYLVYLGMCSSVTLAWNAGSWKLRGGGVRPAEAGPLPSPSGP